jgi:hypothetical protein
LIRDAAAPASTARAAPPTEPTAIRIERRIERWHDARLSGDGRLRARARLLRARRVRVERALALRVRTRLIEWDVHEAFRRCARKGGIHRETLT